MQVKLKCVFGLFKRHAPSSMSAHDWQRGCHGVEWDDLDILHVVRQPQEIPRTLFLMAQRSRADASDIQSTAFRGVLQLMKGYTAPSNWLEDLSKNANILGIPRFEEILRSCRKWQRSRREGNPHNLTDDEILACGLFTFDLGIGGAREEVPIEEMRLTQTIPLLTRTILFLCIQEFLLCIQQNASKPKCPNDEHVDAVPVSLLECA